MKINLEKFIFLFVLKIGVAVRKNTFYLVNFRRKDLCVLLTWSIKGNLNKQLWFHYFSLKKHCSLWTVFVYFFAKWKWRDAVWIFFNLIGVNNNPWRKGDQRVKNVPRSSFSYSFLLLSISSSISLSISFVKSDIGTSQL